MLSCCSKCEGRSSPPCSSALGPLSSAPSPSPSSLLPSTPLSHPPAPQEYCDAGSLSHAVKAGAFHRRLPGGQVGVDLPAVLEVLLEVAGAIQYVHELHLVHCDVKADNVLLKSDAARPLGFVCKLGDFGLAKVLREDYVRNRSGAGTVTHLAPEMLTAGSKLTTAVDAFAFGVLM